MIEKTFFCDGCGRKKQEFEAWWQVQIAPQRSVFGRVLYHEPKVLLMRPLLEEGAEHWHCYCSQQCLITAVSGYMGDNLKKTEKLSFD